MFRLPSNRRFDYTPRFYKPERHHRDGRIAFNRHSTQNKLNRRVIWIFIALCIILYILKKLAIQP